MDELLTQILGYLRGMWRYRWWGLAVAWVVGIAGGVVIYQMPDKYQSSARVFVDTQSVLRPLMSGLAIQPNVDQQITILSRTLISRPNVERLITMADLDLGVQNAAQREALIGRLMSGLRIGGTGRDNLFTLSYEDEEPARAQRVVQALVSLFVESGLVGKRQDSDAARRFIEDQIASYEIKLTEAENRLKEFRLRNMALLGDGARDYVSQIADLSERLNQARLELREVEHSRDAIRRQLEGEEPVLLPQTPGSMSVMIPELDGRIDALKKNLDMMLQRFTENHPDVVGARRVLADLEEQKAREIEAMRAAAPTQFGSPNANPVFQQMKIALSDSEARAASLRARVGELEGRLGLLRQNAELLPKLEAEQAQLNRDYNVHKANYEQLVQRRESAVISAEMNTQSGIADFRVIDPPSLPTQPSAPNRLLLMPLAGLAGLGAAFVLTFLLAQLRPAFQDARMLRETTGLPVLGAISTVPDPAMLRSRRLGYIAFAGGTLFYAAGVGVAAMALQILQR